MKHTTKTPKHLRYPWYAAHQAYLAGEPGGVRADLTDADLTDADLTDADLTEAVRGRVQSMPNRGQLRFTLYDIMTDRAVSCYLSSGNESLMLEAWGRLAIVEGLVRRDPLSGCPTTVRKITDVRIYDDMNPKSYREAVGAAPGRLGDSTPEQAIRRGRDG